MKQRVKYGSILNTKFITDMMWAEGKVNKRFGEVKSGREREVKRSRDNETEIRGMLGERAKVS